MPRDRSTFGYLEGHPDIPNFAQCGSCKVWLGRHDRCLWLPKDFDVDKTDSCILYVQGPPIDRETKATGLLEPKEVGFTKGKVRCENCTSFDKGKSICLLFQKLTDLLPSIFKLDHRVKPRACCNAFWRR